MSYETEFMTLRLAPALAAIALLLGPVRYAAAQSPEERRVVDSAVASYEAMDDGSLQALATIASYARDPLTRLQRGYLLLTVGRRDSDPEWLARAADEFYEVTVRRPNWAYGWFGLGSAKIQLEEIGAREVRSPHQPAGTGWQAGALRAFQRAVKEDPNYGPGVAAMARLALQSERPPTDPEIVAAISSAMARDSTGPALWVLLGRSYRRARRHDEALIAFQRASALHPVDSGAVSLEMARELFTTGHLERALDAYYRGASAEDPAGRGLYRHDIAYVADSTELAEFDSLRTAQRPGWLRTFWTDREMASGRPLGSRLPEHYRRWFYAQEHYRRPSSWARQSDFDMVYRSPDIELDDRGAVYMRHGAPDATAGYVGGRYTPFNVSWLYFRPEQNLVFHFTLGRGVSGWRLTQSFQSIGGGDPEAWASRMGFGHEYGRISFDLETTLAKARAQARFAGSTRDITTVAPEPRTLEAMDRERRAARRSMEIGMSTDSDPLRFKREMAPVVQVFGAGGPSVGNGRLIVAISLPANRHLVPIALPDGGTGYLFRLRVTSADDSGHTTLDSDSLVGVRIPRPLTTGEHLTILKTFDLRATGDQRVRLILTDTARAYGAVRVVNGIPLPDLGSLRPEMSDLIVGKLGSGLAWHRPEGGTVPLHPLNAWHRDEAIEIGFELGGLPAGQPYKVRIGIADLGADTTQPPKASVEFENQASGARELVTQSLGLRSLRPGRYLLTTTVTVGDRVLRRERRVTITAAAR